MNATSTIECFPLSHAAVHIPSANGAAVLQGPALDTALQGPQAGLLLRACQVSTSDDLHSHLWEMHPAGDEVLMMITGAVVVEHVRGLHRGGTFLPSGHGLVMPGGVWHRLVLHEPGLLLALSPRQGTSLSEQPGGPP